MNVCLLPFRFTQKIPVLTFQVLAINNKQSSASNPTKPCVFSKIGFKQLDIEKGGWHSSWAERVLNVLHSVSTDKVSPNLIRQSRLMGCQNAHLWMKFELFHNDTKFALLEPKFAFLAAAIRHVHSHPAEGFWCERSIAYDSSFSAPEMWKVMENAKVLGKFTRITTLILMVNTAAQISQTLLLRQKQNYSALNPTQPDQFLPVVFSDSVSSKGKLRVGQSLQRSLTC